MAIKNIFGTTGHHAATAPASNSAPRSGGPPNAREQFVRDSFVVMAKWDQNRDQKLSAKEIDRALQDPSQTKVHATTICALKANREALAGLKNDEWGYDASVTYDDLLKFKTLKGSNPVAQGVRYSRVDAQSLLRLSENRAFTKEGPKATEINQGELGSCYFLSALVSKAHQDPNFIESMIQPLPGDRYRVSFPSGRSAVVPKPTFAEQAYFTNTNDGRNGYWPTIIEKAYGKTLNEDAWFSTTTIDSEAAGAGGMIMKGVKAMSKGGYDYDSLALTSTSTLKTKLKTAFAENRAVTASTSSRLDALLGKQETTNGLAVGHAYGVLGYDARTETVLVYNPWHSGDPHGTACAKDDGRHDGLFRLTIPEFYANFVDICYEQ